MSLAKAMASRAVASVPGLILQPSAALTPLLTSIRQVVTDEQQKPKPTTKKWLRPITMDFYYDTISPYSWLAFEILQRYKPVWNLKITFKPVLMGGLPKVEEVVYLSSTELPDKPATLGNCTAV